MLLSYGLFGVTCKNLKQNQHSENSQEYPTDLYETESDEQPTCFICKPQTEIQSIIKKELKTIPTTYLTKNYWTFISNSNQMCNTQYQCYALERARHDQLQLKQLLKDNQIDIALVTETFLNKNHSFHLPNYLIYRNDRTSHGGGVLITLYGTK